ncbi:MAG: ABC-F family ATP-binding cassette domain-containing protein, partial [Deltaproteobacteria bacterium]|nr:ABC-F family ATP-binding cassette domain-containing protein [Deltaproteobacteria bacterium]
MLEVNKLAKAYGGQVLFEDASFQISRGERVGLIGRNGHGKTTLLRMIVGQENPDAGNIHLPRHYHIGYVEQSLAFSEPTLLDEACRGLGEGNEQERWRAEKTLAGLGFAHEDMERHPDVFSGGFLVRLNLAKVLLGEPDLLLLDEPTNYLDVVSIRWLVKQLRAWKGELLLVTHDRSFLDQVITHTLAIHRGQLRKMRGDTGKLSEQLDREDEIHAKTRINQQKKRKIAEDYINRFRSKARLASNVQSRIKSMKKMGLLDKLETISDLDFSFSHQNTPAKSVMHAVDLSFGYEKNKLLMDGFSLTVGKEDRIGVIGKNGKGKTTLLRLLAGDLTALQGEVKLHNQTRTSYYAQSHTVELPADSTVEACIMQAGCERQRARGICGLMMFEGDAALKPVRVLSGGEKARVLLGQLLAKPANLLLLDEPTNHLDLQSCDTLVQAIADFPGAAVLVTHNEMFLHALI